MANQWLLASREMTIPGNEFEEMSGTCILVISMKKRIFMFPHWAGFANNVGDEEWKYNRVRIQTSLQVFEFWLSGQYGNFSSWQSFLKNPNQVKSNFSRTETRLTRYYEYLQTWSHFHNNECVFANKMYKLFAHKHFFT